MSANEQRDRLSGKKVSTPRTITTTSEGTIVGEASVSHHWQAHVSKSKAYLRAWDR